MTDVLKSVLKQMYDEYLRTGDADWMSISNPAGKQLQTLGYVTDNVQGDFKLTDKGLGYFKT